MSSARGLHGRTLLIVGMVALGVGLVVVAGVFGAAGAFATTSSGAAPHAAIAAASAGSSSVRVHSHAWGISSGPTTTTGGFAVAAGSDIFVFVGFVNSWIGGGVISEVTDSSGHVYTQIMTTGYAKNHTESLFLTKDVGAASHLKVSVTFAGGDTTQGGAVAAIDVVGQAKSPIDVKAKLSGVGSVAYVGLETSTPGDLFLFGVTGQSKIANVTAGSGERLLNTAGADAGPFTDGEGFGTFSTAGETGPFALAAGLHNAAVWNAIVVGIRPATVTASPL
jgi:hypothetical protein